MPEDYFALLGLTPGEYSSTEIARCYLSQRQTLSAALDHPLTQAEARRALDRLHVAYSALRDPERQRHVRQALADAAPLTRLRLRIAAALEDGLLRHSRRQDILALGQQLGFNEFQTQLVIAQVQFGDDPLALPTRPPPAQRGPRIGRRVALVGSLSAGMFMAVLEWLARG